MLLNLFPLALAMAQTGPRDRLVNRNWLFSRSESAVGREVVNLPHTPVLQDELHPSASFQGVVTYTKVFPPESRFIGRRVVLRFDGAMQVATCWVNGELKLVHKGGYLPFELDLSPELGKGKPAAVRVQVDNRDDDSFNPGRPQRSLDFTYAGGLYRDVWLEVTPTSFISNVYATPTTITKSSASVHIEVQARNPDKSSLEVTVFDPSGRRVADRKVPAAAAVREDVLVANPKLWDLDSPNLYRVETRLIHKGSVLDAVWTRIGIRKLEFDHKSGLRLNGKAIHPQGSNRHMAFPVVGNAASDAAQFREAALLKSIGMDVLRLAHYPQSPAFLDACDELGILVIDPVPGWQFFKNTEEFKNHVLSDIHDMVVRDRNHPCVAIFESCLNETYSAPDSFWIRCSQVAHQAFDPGNFFTGGDSYGKRDYTHPIWDVPWTGWDDQTFTRPALFKMQKGVDREYGDYEFGGEQSTSRADWSDGESALMLQAWNFLWSHNRNRGNPWSFFDLTWEAIDTRRGMSTEAPISKSGLLDFFRRPKPVAYFYESQNAPRPYLKIANEWSKRPSPAKVVVFSNCDEVELFVNGKSVGRQRPDHGPTTGYIGPKTADPMYWAHGKGEVVPASQLETSVGGEPGALPFTGGNCRNLIHPPFTFDPVAYQPGSLKAVGYMAGRKAAKDVVLTPTSAARIVLRVATGPKPLQADGADFVFVYAEVVDTQGQIVRAFRGPVTLQVEGQGMALGYSQRNAVGGVAPFLIRSSVRPGEIDLTARASAMKVGSAKVFSCVAP